MASDGIESKMSGANLRPGTVRELVDETATISSRLTGVIKWFDVSKGFGFIVPDNGMADVLLHVTCLRRDGFQTAYEGARVVCEVLQRAEGPASLPHCVDGRESPRCIRRKCRRRAPM